MRKIANTVYTQEDIILNNEESDITVTLRPLPIARLREFMKVWDEMKELKEDAKDDDVFDIYMRCCGVALRKQLAEKVDDKVYDDKREFTEEYMDLLGEYLDLPSIMKILDICGGVQLADPKLLAEMESLMESQEEDGLN